MSPLTHKNSAILAVTSSASQLAAESAAHKQKETYNRFHRASGTKKRQRKQEKKNKKHGRQGRYM